MKTNTIFIIIVTLAVTVFSYWYFFTETGNQPPLSIGAPPTNQAQMQFEALVGELQPVSFNTNIFSDARFNALVDITTPVAPESFGRLDPLAPLSSVAASGGFSASTVTAPVGTSSAATGGI
ncbi:MAG: hypothetical protein Q8L52_03305 [bacterium]|nr:hypothetical protein [bacterium]